MILVSLENLKQCIVFLWMMIGLSMITFWLGLPLCIIGFAGEHSKILTLLGCVPFVYFYIKLSPTIFGGIGKAYANYLDFLYDWSNFDGVDDREEY